MLTFIVFVFSFMMLVVQFASAQLSPRVTAFAFRNRQTRLPLALFVFTLFFTLGTAGRISEWVPQLMVLLAMLLSTMSVAAFLYQVDYFSRRLRPISMTSPLK